MHNKRNMSPRPPLPGSNDTMVELGMPRFLEDTATTLRSVPKAPREDREWDSSTRGARGGEWRLRIGRYEVGRKLGQGAFGIVFEARDTHLDRLVALKMLDPSHAIEPKIVRRVLQEGRAAARVTHPGIVTVLDCGEEGGVAYLAMELLQGESLANRLQRSGRLSMHDAMELTRQLAAALHAAHEMGVIHRDLKPDNIFIVPDPAAASGERVKVLDFGLAKLRDGGNHTQSNQEFGTPRYMAPEQARSAGDVDHRTDIYALGCILFELVCGRSPFEGEMLQMFEQHQRVRAPRVHELVPEVPHGLDMLIARMLEKPVASRPSTMAIVERELQATGALTPGVAPTMMTSIAPMGTPVSGLRPPAWPMPLAALHALPSVVVTPIVGTPSNSMEVQIRPHPASHLTPQQHAPIFGPNTGMIPVPQTWGEPRADRAVMATPLPVIDAPRWRAGRIGLIFAGAALVVTAIALLTTIALRGPSAEPTASSARIRRDATSVAAKLRASQHFSALTEA